MNDIENREDIELLVNKFYEKVHAEPQLAPIFEIPVEAFEHHLQRTYNFWENWLFQTENYGGRMMRVHIHKPKHHSVTSTLYYYHFHKLKNEFHRTPSKSRTNGSLPNARRAFSQDKNHLVRPPR
ncbi:MAG: truncated hemoglobin YjbI, partial [Spirosomataceae bacterium]